MTLAVAMAVLAGALIGLSRQLNGRTPAVLDTLRLGWDGALLRTLGVAVILTGVLVAER